ncbi:hypothetical protein [Stappia indica]|uniref:hypothetical protein n=1 Tax=Stappia indica TaxID=538381 RepID=UPI0008348E44|nr:hypothetical protein [Stappia indica]
MSTSEHAILCGKCRQPVTARTESHDEEFGCRDCESWASKAEVFEIAKQYATDAAQIGFNRSVSSVARKSKLMTFKGKTSLTKDYRFILADML